MEMISNDGSDYKWLEPPGFIVEKTYVKSARKHLAATVRHGGSMERVNGPETRGRWGLKLEIHPGSSFIQVNKGSWTRGHSLDS